MSGSQSAAGYLGSEVIQISYSAIGFRNIENLMYYLCLVQCPLYRLASGESQQECWLTKLDTSWLLIRFNFPHKWLKLTSQMQGNARLALCDSSGTFLRWILVSKLHLLLSAKMSLTFTWTFLCSRQSLVLGENVRQAGVLRMYGDEVITISAHNLLKF